MFFEKKDISAGASVLLAPKSVNDTLVRIVNTGPEMVYVGVGVSPTPTTGLPLAPGESLAVSQHYGLYAYAVADTRVVVTDATIDVRTTAPRAHDLASDSMRVMDVTPHGSATSTLASVVNGTDGTYYYYVDMAEYRELGLHLILDGGSGSVTVTVEGTMQDDGTDPASCTYADISSAVYGSASWTASAVLMDSSKLAGQCKYVRVTVVASTAGANDADWTIHVKQVW